MHVADTLDRPRRSEEQGRRDLAAKRAAALRAAQPRATQARMGDECPCERCR
ncbi:hypothetical protein FHS78_000656 [Parvibaculum indicum]|uniref:hypothetical protein n=1 Tax=Parvibaculum indicum TaxID=562969 RepID=UPI001422ACE8|nr:hypothetical protein [Parvibaculum indicum]NIJ40386.1 hypothetical protein [Parvibaculum indicum]